MHRLKYGVLSKQIIVHKQVGSSKPLVTLNQEKKADYAKFIHPKTTPQF